MRIKVIKEILSKKLEKKWERNIETEKTKSYYIWEKFWEGCREKWEKIKKVHEICANVN